MSMQLFQLRGRERSSQPSRMDPAQIERLIGVDIPHSRDEVLVHKRHLDLPRTTVRNLHKLIAGCLQRLGAKLGERGLFPEFVIRKKAQAAESPEIIEAELHRISSRNRLKFEYHQIMFGHRSIAMDPEKVPGHFEMPPQGQIVRKLDQDILPAAGDRFDSLPGENFGECPGNK